MKKQEPALPAFFQAEPTREELEAFFGPEGIPSHDGLLSDDRDEVRLPRLRLLQALSPEVKDQIAPAGQFWSEPHGRILQQPFYFTPIQIHREWQFWDGPPPDGKIEYRTDDPNDPKVSGNVESYKNKVHHWLWLVTHETIGDQLVGVEPQLVIFSMRRTQMPAGQTFYTTIRRAGLPPYALRFAVGSDRSKKANDNYVPVFIFKGKVSMQELRLNRSFYETHAATFAQTIVAIEPESENGAAETSAANPF